MMDSTKNGMDRRAAESESRLRQWVADGRTLAQMSQALGMCPLTVKGMLGRLGIAWKPNRFRGPRKMWEKRRPLIEGYCKAGMSLSEMGRLLGTHGHYVHKMIERWGIPYAPYRQAGDKNPAWKGGVSVDADGYVLVYSPDHPNRSCHNTVRLHRLVMEKVLGRPLLPSEVVHHKDKNKLNNTPENLTLYRDNGRHLADELTGKCPKWTEDGKQRIEAGVRHHVLNSQLRRRSATQSSSASRP
jgi:hypothetical protein